MSIAISPKFNGWRAVIHAAGGKQELWFEGQLGKDQLYKFPELKAKLEKVPDDFILDVDIAMTRNGKRVSRPELMKFNQKEPVFDKDEKVIITGLFLPYWKEDLHSFKYSNMHSRLKEFATKYGINIAPIKWCKDKEDIAKAGKWAFAFDTSEGLVAVADKEFYDLDGSTNEMAKIKKVAEIKVIVLGKQTTKAGDFNYTGGLLPSEDFDYSNLTELEGKEYVDLGKSFSTNINAKKGDILTVTVLEIIPDDKKKVLSWLGARVLDIDKTRSTPYYVSQVIDIARRKGVLQEIKKRELKKEDLVILAALGYKIKKQDEEGGETRGAIAEKNWEDNWALMLPKTGKGSFGYQQHFRGLNEEESKLSRDALLDTDHSLHGDLRFEDTDALWGFSVFLGEPKENKKVGGDKLVAVKPDDAIQGNFKLSQPKQWLKIGGGKGTAFAPGEPGATSKTWAKFFMVDSGDYELGVCKLHFYEIFFKGDKLKGRYIIQSIPMAGKRIWTITKPKDQTPFAEREDLSEQIKDQQKKNRKWIYWNIPGGKPKIIDLKKVKPEDFAVEKGFIAQIFKSNEEKQIVYGVVLEPWTDVTSDGDTQGHRMTAEEIEKTAHNWLEKHRKADVKHSFKKVDAVPVESYIAPDNFEVNGEEIKKGTWIIGMHIQDARLWQDIKSGEYNAFSPGGFGRLKDL